MAHNPHRDPNRAPARGARLMLLTGHSAPVVAAAFPPDGRILATGSYDGTVILWDAASGAMLRRLPGHELGEIFIVFSADGQVLASADCVDVIRLWRVSTGRRMRTIRGFSGPLFSASDPDLLIAIGDAAIVWLDIRTGRPARTAAVEHSSAFRSTLGVSLDETTAATVVCDTCQPLQIRDLRTGELRRVRRIPGTLWQRERDPLTGCLRCAGSAQAEVEHLALSPDGRTLSLGGIFTLWLCDTRTGRRKHLLICGGDGAYSVVFSPDGKTLASGTRAGSVKLWTVASGKLTQSLDSHTSWASAVAFSPDGQMLASGSHDKTVKLWRASTGECLRKLPALEFDVSALAYSPDGAIIASGHEDATVRLWSAVTGELEWTFPCPGPSVTSVAFSAASDTLAVSSGQQLDWSAPGAIELWDPRTRALKRSFLIDAGPMESLAFSGDGRLLVGSSSRPEHGVTLIWEADTGRLRYSVEGSHAVLSPGDQLLATADWDGKIALRSALSGDLVRELASPKAPSEIVSLVFSPDGRTLAAGYLWFRFALWDVGTGRLLWKARTHADSISSLAFSPNGSTLAAGGDYDATVALWDLQMRRRKATLKGHTNNICSVAFSPDGSKVVTASADRTVRLWDAATGRLLATLMVLPSTGEGISEDWITFTPDGYYQASPGAARFVRWSAGAAIYGAEQFEGMFHRPEMLREALR